MWIIIVRGPSIDLHEFVLPAGKFTVGSRPGNDLVLNDESASPEHAELVFETTTDTLSVHDLGSTNGTFVNHEQVTQSVILQSEDQIRIGQHLIRIVHRDIDEGLATNSIAETQPLTRDLLLESLDRHAGLLLEVSERLNTLIALPKALEAVSSVVGMALGVNSVQVIHAAQFAKLAELGFPTTLAQRAIDERSVIAIPDVQARPDLALSHGAQQLAIRSIICVPVLVGDEVAALICVNKKAHIDRPLSQDDVHIAVVISYLASLTIQRARLLENVESIKELATTDSLTQLYDRKHFLELAEQEVQRARRFRRPLTAILLDLDHLQQLNDAHGHAAGDEVLRAVAARCRLALRQVDLVGRNAGDEFAILGLETDVRMARMVAERLRELVAGSPIYTDRGLVHVTISLGIAPLSDDCPNLPMLLDKAKAALTMAKSSGGDRIEVLGDS
jgi:diguanylate cyclase (GGDEF)-like protein